MLHLNSDGRDAYEAGDFTSAAAAFESTLTGNVLERWVAPYDLGTAEYRQDDFGAARRHLEEALALAPAEEECRVRINLALADEALGDAAVADGDVTSARDHWATGRAVLAEGGCTGRRRRHAHQSLRPPVAGSSGQVLTAIAVDSRLADKLGRSQEPDRNRAVDQPPRPRRTVDRGAQRGGRAAPPAHRAEAPGPGRPDARTSRRRPAEQRPARRGTAAPLRLVSGGGITRAPRTPVRDRRPGPRPAPGATSTSPPVDCRRQA